MGILADFLQEFMQEMNHYTFRTDYFYVHICPLSYSTLNLPTSRWLVKTVRYNLDWDVGMKEGEDHAELLNLLFMMVKFSLGSNKRAQHWQYSEWTTGGDAGLMLLSDINCYEDCYTYSISQQIVSNGIKH